MLLEIHSENPNNRQVSQAVDCLKRGGVIIYPTDTVYAFGCDINSKTAVEKICKLLGIKTKKKMCGIAGILGKNAKSNVIDDMLIVQHHRGPDYKGKWLENGVALGHNRLSIIDNDPRSNQPFTKDGESFLLYNGEIYNFSKLKSLLKSNNIKLATTSDTEIIYEL